MKSTIDSDRLQKDGRRSIVERHVLDDGREAIVSYMAVIGFDATKALNDHAAALVAGAMQDQEERDAADLEASIDDKVYAHAEKQPAGELVVTWGMTTEEALTLKTDAATRDG